MDLRRFNELDTGASAAAAHYHEDARGDTSVTMTLADGE